MDTGPYELAAEPVELNAGRPRPGYCTRKRGNRNDEASAKAMKEAPTTASPILWPVVRASGSTREVKHRLCSGRGEQAALLAAAVRT